MQCYWQHIRQSRTFGGIKMEKQCEKSWYYKIINDETNEVECYTKVSVHIKAEKLCELIGIEGCHAVEITEDEYKEESE